MCAASIRSGDADDTVLVGRVLDEAGNMVATLVNLRVPSDDARLGEHAHQSRFPRRLRSRGECDSAPCVFFQGASGDLGPRKDLSAIPRSPIATAGSSAMRCCRRLKRCRRRQPASLTKGQ